MKDFFKKLKQVTLAIIFLIVSYIVLSFIFAIVFKLTKSEALSYLISYLIANIVLVLINHNKLMEDIKNFKNDYQKNIKSIILLTIVFIILMMVSNMILYELSGNLANNEETARQLFKSSPIIMFLSIGFFGPIFEELVSRYPYRDIKINKNIKLIIYSSIFAMLHISSISNIYDILFIIPYLFLSLAFSFSFYKTNNILGSMIVHILNNSLSLLLISII